MVIQVPSDAAEIFEEVEMSSAKPEGGETR
jgi:hypothetical protein